MKHWIMYIKALTDTMPGSGESVPGVIDSDIRYDDFGLPCMSAKTMKGLLREQMEFLKEFDPDYQHINLNDLLGGNDIDAGRNGRLKFSDVTVTPGLKEIIMNAEKNGEVTKTEILNALTVVNVYTKIDSVTGTAADHSLRSERMVRKGIDFISEIAMDTDGLDEETVDLYSSFVKDSVSALQHIGTHKSKGKGAVSCRLEGRD